MALMGGARKVNAMRYVGRLALRRCATPHTARRSQHSIASTQHNTKAPHRSTRKAKQGVIFNKLQSTHR
jgi:hypothetical protein